jgi:flagella basal body P-ring formation protein FlgA
MRTLACFLTGAFLWAGPATPPVTAVERLQQAALAYVEAQAAGLPGAYVFRVVTPPVLPRSAGDLRFEPDHLSRRDLGGRFFASFTTSLDGRSLGMVRVDMEGKWTGKLLRTRIGLVRKAVPELAQMEEVDFEGTPPVGALAELPGGFRLRGPLAPGHILTQADLEPIPVVLAGDQVRLEVVSGTLTITLETLARSNGAMGEKVRLELPTSHKTYQAFVTGPDQATSQWAGSK